MGRQPDQITQCDEASAQMLASPGREPWGAPDALPAHLRGMVEQARPDQRPLRVWIEGMTGTGKTWSALELHKALGGRCVLLSCGEHSAESLYGGRFDFDRVSLDDLAAWAMQQVDDGRYVGPIPLGSDIPTGDASPLTGADPRVVAYAIRQFGAVYDVLILDSLSEVWGKARDQVDLVATARPTKKGEPDTRSAWAAVTPVWESVPGALMSVPAHTIATVRSKMVRDHKTQRDVESAEVRDRDRFRPDVIVRLDERHAGTVIKARYPSIDGQIFAPLNGDMVRAIAADRAKGAPRGDEGATDAE